MSRTELIPLELMFADQVDKAIAWINKLPGRKIDKKEMLAEWCKQVGIELTAELVERVYPGG